MYFICEKGLQTESRRYWNLEKGSDEVSFPYTGRASSVFVKMTRYWADCVNKKQVYFYFFPNSI